MKTGLLSVTFRKLSPDEIIKLVVQAGLQAIEWGGDIHVPHGDVKRAEEVGRKTREAGLEVASYGSYYRVGHPPEKLLFGDVLKSACALRAPAIRVWAGDRASAVATPQWRDQVATDARRIADLAQDCGMTIDFEYHNGTLTDTSESAVSLLRQIDHPNVRCNWQTAVPGNFAASNPTLQAILPWLTNVHVFHWVADQRRPLLDGAADWQQYIKTLRGTGKPHCLMLEFVKDDDPGQFLLDAAALIHLIEISGGKSRL